MKNMLLAIIGLTCSLAVLADTPEANIKKLLQPRMGDTAVIESVIKTPYNNLYEVKIGSWCTPMQKRNSFLSGA